MQKDARSAADGEMAEAHRVRAMEQKYRLHYGEAPRHGRGTCENVWVWPAIVHAAREYGSAVSAGQQGNASDPIQLFQPTFADRRLQFLAAMNKAIRQDK